MVDLDRLGPPCRWVRLARERQERDLSEGPGRGLYFCAESWKRVVDFFPRYMKHYIGEWAGQPFKLAGWQIEDVVKPLFGWKRLPAGMTAADAKRLGPAGQKANGCYRRFRKGYLCMARGGGKTSFGAGIGNYMMAADNEAAAHCYAVATKFDQAFTTIETAQELGRKNRRWMRAVRIMNKRIVAPKTASYFRALGRDSKSEDSRSVHFVDVDEYHAHVSSGMYSVMVSSQGKRKEPLALITTTAGFHKKFPCFREQQMIQDILMRLKRDDSYFGIIYTLDEGDDFEDETVWHKANPNLGVSPTVEFLRGEVQAAVNMPSKRVEVLTKNFNRWCDSASSWLNLRDWDACTDAIRAKATESQRLSDAQSWRERKLLEHRGDVCAAGLDLGAVSDLTALVLLFAKEVSWTHPDTGVVETVTGYDLIPFFWVPKDGQGDRDSMNHQFYREWFDAGFMFAVPGRALDYKRLRRDVSGGDGAGGLTGGGLTDAYAIQVMAVDRWQAAQLAQQFEYEDGMEEVYSYGQGYASMQAPCKRLAELVLMGLVDHGGNPVLRWMVENLIVTRDAAGNMKPDKEESGEKIDGMVALLMALGRRMELDEDDGKSVYETDDLVSV